MRDDLDDLDDEMEAETPGYKALVAARTTVKLLAYDLRKRREGAGLTQKEVARRMGTTQAMVSQIEAGKDVTVTTLVRYLAAIGVEDAVGRLAAK